jgi:ribose transport system permease protein
VNVTVIYAHVISGGLAAMAGMMAVARLQIGQPTIGDDWLLLSFAAPVIGGAVLSGGHVSVSATVLGVAIVAIINQTLVMFRVDPFLVQVVLGGLILWAVGMNRWRESRALKNSVKVA